MSTPARKKPAKKSVALKPASYTSIRNELRSLASKEIAEHAKGFFKSGPGEYGEGDKFLGIRVPHIRQQVRNFEHTDRSTTLRFLASAFHEERLFALLMLVRQFQRGDESQKKDIYNTYLNSTGFINNWDLVDCSAYQIVGAWLQQRNRKPLYKLARSQSLWERRIAVMSTFQFIRDEDLDDTFKLCELLLSDEEDLIHKVCGWMLREAGKRDGKRLYRFLDQHAATMPRTMLRYSLEKLPQTRRRQYMQQK